MNLFRPATDDISEDEGLSDAQIRKKKQRRKLCQPDNTGEPVFKGKVNLPLKELKKEGNEIWLVKLPANVRPERFEGHDILLADKATSVLELNNGTLHDAVVTKEKMTLPLVCPKSGKKDLVAERVEQGLKIAQACDQRRHGASAKCKDLEEEADTISLPIKGNIVLSRHIQVSSVPEQQPEVIEKIVQPTLKRRHPFFGTDEPLEEIKQPRGQKKSRSKK